MGIYVVCNDFYNPYKHNTLILFYWKKGKHNFSSIGCEYCIDISRWLAGHKSSFYSHGDFYNSACIYLPVEEKTTSNATQNVYLMYVEKVHYQVTVHFFLSVIKPCIPHVFPVKSV